MSERRLVQQARRIVIKIGSSSLTTAAGGLAIDQLRRIVDVVAHAKAGGADVVLVSSGAIAAGLAPLGFKRRPEDLAHQQAAASVGQGLLVHRYTEEFARHNIVASQVLITADDVTRRRRYRNAQQTFTALLNLGAVPIVNENDTVATREIRFGDNDRIAALVAHLIQADLLVLLTDVDGLYDRPPKEAGAQLITEVAPDDQLGEVTLGGVGSHIGSGGMHTKIEAALIARSAGIPVVVTSASLAGPAVAGETVGTLFHAPAQRRSARLLWLQYATDAAGSLTVDAGAVTALQQDHASLLPAGITAVDGSFVAGDPVDILNPAGVVIGRGLVNYSSGELPQLFGRSTYSLEEELGAAYGREVIHRDDLIML